MCVAATSTVALRGGRVGLLRRRSVVHIRLEGKASCSEEFLDAGCCAARHVLDVRSGRRQERRLQQALNPNGRVIAQSGGRLRVGDRVMQMRNDHQREVYNGDLGRVLGVDEETGSVRVAFDQREVECEPADLDSLVLSYATSIQKSRAASTPPS